jgi:hypothetical protein
MKMPRGWILILGSWVEKGIRRRAIGLRINLENYGFFDIVMPFSTPFHAQ